MKSIYRSLKKRWMQRTGDSFLDFHRQKGYKIGKGTVAFDPQSIVIDYSRPSLIEIGERVFLHKGLSILTHDFASWVLVGCYSEFLPSAGKVKIGNNVWFGYNCTVLKGVTIGDNCIIGVGSVVSKDIPANSVAAGTPAKVICTIDEYYNKRKEVCVEESLEYARSIKERFNREPVLEDFKNDDYTCFIDGSNYKDYPTIPYNAVLKGEHFDLWLKNHKAAFNGFDDFIKSANLK